MVEMHHLRLKSGVVCDITRLEKGVRRSVTDTNHQYTSFAQCLADLLRGTPGLGVKDTNLMFNHTASSFATLEPDDVTCN
jgi:hypothetical protein